MGISSAMFTGVTGLETFGNALSVVSDNIANANSTAYKANSALFCDLVSGYLDTQSPDMEASGAGTAMAGVTTDFATGATMQTGTWSNVMIQGNGFFSVQNASGAAFYTRDGTFHVDADGYLVNTQGYQVLNSDGDPIQIEADPTDPTYVAYEIDGNGVITGTLPNNGGTVTIGTLRVSTFPNPEGLIRNGQNLYYPGSTAGTAVDGTASAGSCGQIVSGAIEGSNVDLAREMVNMIIFQADYTANSKSITTANNMLDTVVNLIR